MIELRQPAANDLIELMRKERDKKVMAFINDPANKDAIKAYFEERKKKKEGK